MSDRDRYMVEILPPNWEGFRYAVRFSKLFGDRFSGMTEFKSKEELIEFLRNRVFREWEKYDSILERYPAKVTKKNLIFESFTEDITKEELLGVKTLSDFFGGNEEVEE